MAIKQIGTEKEVDIKKCIRFKYPMDQIKTKRKLIKSGKCRFVCQQQRSLTACVEPAGNTFFLLLR